MVKEINYIKRHLSKTGGYIRYFWKNKSYEESAELHLCDGWAIRIDFESYEALKEEGFITFEKKEKFSDVYRVAVPQMKRTDLLDLD